MAISPSRSAAFDILMRVEQGAFADELLHSEHLETLSPLDRALCTEIVMGVLRWRSWLDDTVACWSNTAPSKLDPKVATALRMGTYQVALLARVPAHAAVNETVELVKRSRRRFAAPMVNAVMRKIASAKLRPSAIGEEISFESLASNTAHPLWLLRRWASKYGFDVARKIAQYDQHVPVPTLHLRDATAEQHLRNEGVELAPGVLVAGARRVISGDVTKTSIFAEGRAYLQDEASQLVALLVGSGERILDCCAAPGGKTSVIAARNPNSQVIAADLHPVRVRLMHRLVQASNVRVIAADAEELPLMPGFDRVLADVPCSGTGTLARNPEIKWRLRSDDLADLHGRQVSILRAALASLVPGGRLVYSTCSLECEENEDVVAEVLNGRQDLRLRGCRTELQRLQNEGALVFGDIESLVRGNFLRTIPGVHLCDGFFAAMIEG